MAYETKPNQAKIDTVARLEEKLESVEGIIFADFSGLSVAEINKLRSSFFEAGEVDFIVSKNTLMSIALKSRGYENLESILKGNTAMALGYNDPVKPIKLMADFAKDTKGKLPFKGGVISGDIVDAAELDALKDIPPIDVLYSMIVGGISSPLSGFVGVLNETLRSFVAVLDAIIEQKKAAGAE